MPVMLKTTYKIIRILFYALLVLIGVTFAVSNRDRVGLTFYPFPYSVSVPMYIIAVTLFIAGALAAWAIIRVSTFKERMLHKRTVRRMQALENEISALRSEQLLQQPAPAKAQITAVK